MVQSQEAIAMGTRADPSSLAVARIIRLPVRGISSLINAVHRTQEDSLVGDNEPEATTFEEVDVTKRISHPILEGALNQVSDASFPFSEVLSFIGIMSHSTFKWCLFEDAASIAQSTKEM